MSTRMSGGLSDFLYHIDQLMTFAAMKAALAAVVSFFVEVLFGDVIVLHIFFGLCLLDLICGVIQSVVWATFQPKYLLSWVKKLFTHAFLILIFGLVAHAFFRTTDIIFPLVNWLLLFCSFTEVVSIISHMKDLGFPIPAFVTAIVASARKRAAVQLSVVTGDTSVVEQLVKDK